MSAKDEIDNEYTSTQDKILYYLKSGLEKGKRYFKSKYIAKDLGLSPKEVGTNLAILAEICEELEISRWSYSNSTTWKVSPRAIL
ncbi:MAG: hypothetical protein PHV39_03120 [Methanomicrobium sp.]|nr:hypothetical protein [Methanomicrobium sp.]